MYWKVLSWHNCFDRNTKTYFQLLRHEILFLVCQEDRGDAGWSSKRWEAGWIVGSHATVAWHRLLFYFSFREREKEKERTFPPSPTPLRWRSIYLPRFLFFFLSRAFDRLWRENRGSVNRLPNNAKTFAINKAGGKRKVREAVGLDLPWVACSRRSDSRARRLLGSELKCTPGKRGEGKQKSLPSFMFLCEFFSRALLSEHLEQARIR